jgi:glycosyltransferase involved in cell wall biosynthesis
MRKFVIISPCYNEEKVIIPFLKELEEVFSMTEHIYTVIVVDDCSTDSTPEKLIHYRFQSEKFVLKPISLKYNIGHQGAIKQGLKYAERYHADGYIVIDSDGEDDPYAICKLTNENYGADIVFVTRGNRSESLFFRISYYCYKILFKSISGNKIHFGNFSMITKKVLNIINIQEFEHYPAFLSKLKYNKNYIQFDRRKRIDGVSKMSYNNLVLHGLKSLIEYAEHLLFFFIRILILLMFVLIIFGFYVLYSYFIKHNAIQGWASTMVLGLINSILITSGIIVLGLLILSQKKKSQHKSDLFFEI